MIADKCLPLLAKALHFYIKFSSFASPPRIKLLNDSLFFNVDIENPWKYLFLGAIPSSEVTERQALQKQEKERNIKKVNKIDRSSYVLLIVVIKVIACTSGSISV